jgi:hypothetical protein
MLRIDLFCGLFLAEMFRCVSEHGVIVNDAWHVSIVGVKFSGCMSAPPEATKYVCSLPKGSSYVYLFVLNKRSMVSDCLMFGIRCFDSVEVIIEHDVKLR